MISTQAYAEALYLAVTETKSGDHDKVLDNFIKLLKENNDLGRYEEIEKEYLNIERKAKGIEQVQVKTARNVDHKSLLETLNKVVAGKLEIQHEVDPSLIGGVVIRAGDNLIDASLKHSLDTLKKAITTK